jgi:hypothetical protein
MHKTGSSSIQDHFFSAAHDGITYPRWNNGNLCGLFILLFQDEGLLGDYHGFRSRGPEFVARLPQLRSKWRASLEEDMQASAGKTVIFSAEDISYPGFRNAVETMAAFFRQWTDDISIVGYVRKPLSFAVSAFQQMLKDGGLRNLDPGPLWPHYALRFAMLEEVFGRDRITLRLYERGHMRDGDVVRDFGALLGLDIPKSTNPEANVSLSAEATALLFAQRKLGDGFVSGFPGAQQGNAAFVEALRQIGTKRFTFADSLWEPHLASNADDLAWIEDRLGMPMRDVPSPDAIAIGSEDDLIRLAVESYPALEQVLLRSIRRSQRPPLQKTVRALDLLRKLSY